MKTRTTVPDRDTVSTFIYPGCDGPLVPVQDDEQDAASAKTVNRYWCPQGCGAFEYVHASRRFHEIVGTAEPRSSQTERALMTCRGRS